MTRGSTRSNVQETTKVSQGSHQNSKTKIMGKVSQKCVQGEQINILCNTKTRKTEKGKL